MSSSPSTYWLTALGLQMRMRDVGGVTTRSLEAGSGAATILLHGMQASAENHIRNLLPLSQDLRVIAPDLIGHGMSGRPDVAYDIRDYMHHVLSLMDALGIERAHFVGQSLGGWIAARIAAEHPSRVGRLVLNTSAGLPVSTGDEPKLLDLYRMCITAATSNDRDAMAARLRWAVKDPSIITDEIVALRMAFSQQEGARTIAERLAGLTLPERYASQHLSDEVLSRIEAPTLLIWTEDNPIHGADAARRAAELIGDASVEIVPDAGHWPQFEQPDIFNRAVREFLSQGSLD